jgi:hypothetical protein
MYYNPYDSYVQNSNSGGSAVNTQPLYSSLNNVKTPSFLTSPNNQQSANGGGNQATGQGGGMMGKPGIAGIGGALASGLSSLDMGNKTPNPSNQFNQDDFEIDQWAGYKASGQGFASAGPFGAIIGGAIAQLGTFNKVHNNLGKLDRSVAGTQGVDAYGRPIYNAGGIANQYKNLNALKKGAYRTTHTVDPGQPTIALIRGTRRKLRKAARDVQTNIGYANQDYTNKTNAYNQQEMAMNQYNQLLNNRNRMNTLYNIGTQLY